MNIHRPQESDRELINRIKLRITALEAYVKAALDHCDQVKEMLDEIQKRSGREKEFLHYHAN